jgi:hypothetical protein
MKKMNFTMLCIKLLIGIMLTGETLMGQSAATGLNHSQTPDNKSILENMPGQVRFPMPAKLFPPGLAKDMEAYPVLKSPFACLRGNAARAAKWTAIPDDQWKRIIRDVTPWTVNPSGAPIVCPFCKERKFTKVKISEEDFLTNPLQYKTQCCGAVIYGEESAMPPAYKAKPNRDIVIPQLDGPDRTYHFFAYPADGGKEKLFMSEGEVWNANIDFIYKTVLPDLMAAVYANKDEKAAVTLCVILDRIADVYPALPLLETHTRQGLARGKDGKSYLTRDEYRSVKRPNPYGRPFYWRHGMNWNKLGPAGGGWQDYVMNDIGNLAEAYALIEDVPAVREYSQKKYGSKTGALDRIRERLLKEAAYMMSAVSDTRGNTVIAWVNGALKLGIVLQDPLFFNLALSKYESAIINMFYADGLSEQAAFNYALMMRGFVHGTDMVKYFGKFDLDTRYPFLKVIRETTDYPVMTLFNIQSMHQDEHGRFMASGPGARITPDKQVQYAKHEKSQNFPEYGLTCLRGGGPGERIETIVDYQNTVGHKSQGNFNLQLFFEGMNLLPDIGYATGPADITSAPFNKLKYPFELLPPPNNEYGMSWTWKFANMIEAHCTAAVDSYGGRRGGPATFERFFGGQGLDNPAYSMQVFEGRSPATFQPIAVKEFSRQLTTLSLPGGRSVLVDIFRITGGQRHDLFWHFPAAAPAATFGPGVPTTKNFAGYRSEKPVNAQEKTSPGAQFLTSLAVSPMPPAWQATWTIDPEPYGPVTPAGKAAYASQGWKDALKKVKLRLWSAALGTPAAGEIIQAKMPWPSNAPEPQLRGVIAFKDGLDVLIESRRAAVPGLSSSFVHVLEPYKSEPSLESVQINQAPAGDSKNGVIIRMVPKPGTNPVFFGSTTDARQVKDDTFSMTGRAGMIAPEALQANLYDGSEIRAGKMSLQIVPTWSCQLKTVVGDLSGNLLESALIISSATPLPLDAALVGQTITVNHKISKNHRSGYVIDKVSKLASGDYRLDLRGTPPFIHNKLIAVDRDPANRRMFLTDVWMMKGQGAQSLMSGRIALFPRTGFSTPIEGTRPCIEMSVPSDAHTDRIILTTEPTADQVAIGDGFVVYSIQPGDEVVIPSFAAVKSVNNSGAGKTALELCTSSAMKLTLPLTSKKAVLETGKQKLDLPVIAEAGSTSLQIPALVNGRGTLELELK